MSEQNANEDFWNALALAAIVFCMAMWMHL